MTSRTNSSTRNKSPGMRTDACWSGRVPLRPSQHLTPRPLSRRRPCLRTPLLLSQHPGSSRPVVFPNNPIKYTGTPLGIYRRAPKLGEHTAEVLSELEGAP